MLTWQLRDLQSIEFRRDFRVHPSCPTRYKLTSAMRKPRKNKAYRVELEVQIEEIEDVNFAIIRNRKPSNVIFISLHGTSRNPRC